MHPLLLCPQVRLGLSPLPVVAGVRMAVAPVWRWALEMVAGSLEREELLVLTVEMCTLQQRMGITKLHAAQRQHRCERMCQN